MADKMAEDKKEDYDYGVKGLWVSSGMYHTIFQKIDKMVPFRTYDVQRQPIDARPRLIPNINLIYMVNIIIFLKKYEKNLFYVVFTRQKKLQFEYYFCLQKTLFSLVKK